MKGIHNNKLIRPIFMKALKILDFDISIKHHWTSLAFKLNLFKHKGYWYHGKKRENSTMRLFGSLIDIGDTVVEVGGHIGYISLYFSKLVGHKGGVIVFEPGNNNIPYISKNIENIENIRLIKKAVGDFSGEIDFFEDNLTGQNNSIVENFEGFIENSKASYVKSGVVKTLVPIVTLDSELNQKIDFIKIDIEAGEYKALLGASQLIERQQPILMVEIQADESKIYNMLDKFGYLLFTPELNKVSASEGLAGNIFCLHNIKHKNLIEKYFVKNR